MSLDNRYVDPGFAAWLSKNRCKTPQSLYSYLLSIKLFKRWLSDQNIETEKLTFRNIMSFVEHCRSKGDQQNTISQKILVVRLWLDYRGMEPNPCGKWHLKRRTKYAPPYLLSSIEIEKMYHQHPQSTTQEIKDKVMLGLMIYQGCNGGNLRRLESNHFNLDVGFVIIISAARMNSRSIKIHTSQKELLAQYIKDKKGRLFNNHYHDFYERLRSRYSNFHNGQQLRCSVITNWLKTHNLREVQYMAGHRYVSSTERYLANNVEDLQKKLDEVHPLR